MKKTNRCLRCGKREGFGKSHECIQNGNDTFYLCVDCAQIAYRIKDAVNEKKYDIADGLKHEFKSLPKEPNAVLTKWFDEHFV